MISNYSPRNRAPVMDYVVTASIYRCVRDWENAGMTDIVPNMETDVRSEALAEGQGLWDRGDFDRVRVETFGGDLVKEWT